MNTEGNSSCLGAIVVLVATIAFIYMAVKVGDVSDQMKRSNDIECIRLEHDAVDSLGKRDRDACG